MEISKMPDRLNYSTKANQLIVKVDEENFMGLGIKSITRSDLFLFAMSLGVESKSPTEVKKPYTGGLVLDKSINGKTKACMYAQFIYLLKDPENELDAIAKKNEVYKTAEQYANTGFEFIADYLEKNKPEELVLDLISELDGQYEAIKSPIAYSYDESAGYAAVAEDK